ncbi:MAG: hypothetical protein JO166_14705 [Deltaproteobacteria bacterium]|nr:hypothetical protein [Deltaproteobacteria bacterium]
MPWLRPEQGPVLRQWAELEELRTCCFAGLVQYGALRVEANEISAKRLVHDLRQIVQVQIVLERELLMTPAARAQMKAVGSGDWMTCWRWRRMRRPSPRSTLRLRRRTSPSPAIRVRINFDRCGGVIARLAFDGVRN